MIYLKTYLASLVILAVLDYIWLGLIIKNFTNQQLAPVARMSEGQVSPVMWAALLVYLVMGLAATLFVAPKAEVHSIPASFAWGAALGFVIYAIYDMTNYAILKDYPLTFALVDIAWGTFLFGATGAVLCLILPTLHRL